MATTLVLFDCDGVLVDSEPIACAATAEQLQRLGLAITAQEIATRYIGMSAASLYADLERRCGLVVTPAQRQALNHAVDDRLAATVPAMPGVAEAIDALTAAGLAVCVASSGTPRRIEGSLRRAGLWGRFEGRVFSATQVANGKPAPDLFLYAAQKMGAAPAQCVVVEDSLAGARAARAAAMRCLGFTGGGHTHDGLAEALRAEGVVQVLGAMAALPAAVAGLADAAP